MSATDLLVLTAELVEVASVSRHEGPLADTVERALRTGCPWLAVERVGDNVVARTSLGRRQRLLVAGHLDTVRPATAAGDVATASGVAARLDGDTLWGLGAADMKGGLAVMLDLARTVPAPALDVTWCFYAREEVDRAESGLAEVWAERPDLLAADAAVLGEPTDSVVEAGCQGTLRMVVELGGVRAHTARPFTGRNAIHRLAPLLDRVVGWEGRVVVLDGCEFAEQLQVVSIAGGVANNVVPDRATMTLNHRYAPDRDGRSARAFLAALFEGALDEELGDRCEVVDEADGAPPLLDHPLVARLLAASGQPPRAKVGWTDVASFWAHGVPAVNFGPGDPLLAHHPDERVTRGSLERAHQVLAALLAGEPAAAD